MPYLPDYQISVYTPADREVEVWKPMEIVLQGGRLVSLFQIKFENCTCPRSNWCHSSLIRNMFDCNHLCCARSLSEVVLYLQGLFLRLGNRDKIPGKKGRKSGAGEAGLVCWWQLPTAHGFQGCSGHNIGTDRLSRTPRWAWTASGVICEFVAQRGCTVHTVNTGGRFTISVNTASGLKVRLKEDCFPLPDLPLICVTGVAQLL